MQKFRKCAKCGHPSLRPASQKIKIYNSIIHYNCDVCEAEIDITPTASIGVLTTVGLLALGFWGWILFSDSSPPGWVAILFYGLAIIGLGYVTLGPTLVHMRNPVLSDSIQTDLPVDAPNSHLTKRPIIWIEQFGFLAGLLAPLLLIFSVLGIASIIGFINFTYFGN